MIDLANVFFKGELAELVGCDNVSLSYKHELTAKAFCEYLASYYPNFGNYINNYGQDELIVLVENRILRPYELVIKNKDIILLILPSGG